VDRNPAAVAIARERMARERQPDEGQADEPGAGP